MVFFLLQMYQEITSSINETALLITDPSGGKYTPSHNSPACYIAVTFELIHKFQIFSDKKNKKTCQIAKGYPLNCQIVKLFLPKHPFEKRD